MSAGATARRRGVHRALLACVTGVCVLGSGGVAAAIDLDVGASKALPDVDTRAAVEPSAA